MAHSIHFINSDGWRKRARIVERSSGNNNWEVLTISATEDSMVVRCGTEYRQYDIRERVDNDYWRGTLASVETR